MKTRRILNKLEGPIFIMKILELEKKYINLSLIISIISNLY